MTPDSQKGWRSSWSYALLRLAWGMRSCMVSLCFLLILAALLIASFCGCRAMPPQTAGTIRDVAGSLTQTIEQQMGVKPAMLLQYSMGGSLMAFGVLLGFMLLMWQARALKSVRVRVAMGMASLCFIAVGIGIVLRLNGG